MKCPHFEDKETEPGLAHSQEHEAGSGICGRGLALWGFHALQTMALHLFIQMVVILGCTPVRQKLRVTAGLSASTQSLRPSEFRET